MSGKKPKNEEEASGGGVQPKQKDAKKDHREQKESQRRVMIVRVAGKDLDGSQPLSRAIKDIRGVSFGMGKAIAMMSGLGGKKVSDLSPAETSHVETMLKKPQDYGVPAWLLNRRGDPMHGVDRHIVSADLDLTQKMDINELKKKRSYKGVRHIAGLPVRGQRTRSSFRKSGKAVGVNRAKAKAAKAGPAAAGKK